MRTVVTLAVCATAWLVAQPARAQMWVGRDVPHTGSVEASGRSPMAQIPQASMTKSLSEPVTKSLSDDTVVSLGLTARLTPAGEERPAPRGTGLLASQRS